MNKRELFEHLKTIKDKSGGFKKPESIKKNYPEIYKELETIVFPDYYSFPQKLWHFLQDDFTVHKCECGNELKFIDFKKGYRLYCSKICQHYLNHNKETICKAQEVSRQKESRIKAVETTIKHKGGKFWTDDEINNLKKTYKEHLESRYIKRKKTIKELIKEYEDLTGVKLKGCSSNVEIRFYKYLIDKFGIDNVEPQYYNSNKYPFACDFYIPKLDVYIEIQGCWTHGNHPFNNTDEDIEKLRYWKNKHSKYYDNAIYTWTNLDVRKREKANEMKLNYLEIFSYKLEKCISIFEEYISKLK